MNLSLKELKKIIKENSDLYMTVEMNNSIMIETYCYKDGTVFDIYINKYDNEVIRIVVSD